MKLRNIFAMFCLLFTTLAAHSMDEPKRAEYSLIKFAKLNDSGSSFIKKMIDLNQKHEWRDLFNSAIKSKHISYKDLLEVINFYFASKYEENLFDTGLEKLYFYFLEALEDDDNKKFLTDCLADISIPVQNFFWQPIARYDSIIGQLIYGNQADELKVILPKLPKEYLAKQVVVTEVWTEKIGSDWWPKTVTKGKEFTLKQLLDLQPDLPIFKDTEIRNIINNLQMPGEPTNVLISIAD